MVKITKVVSFILLIIVMATCFGCVQKEQPDTRTSFEKIVDFIEETGKDNSIFIEGSNPTENIKISVVGNIIRLERGDGNYLPSDGISNTLQLDLKENEKEYNYEGYWCQNGGSRLYKIQGEIIADKQEPSSFNPIPYETYSSYAKAPTILELEILNGQMGILITEARAYIKEKIDIDLFIEFGFDKFL